MQKAVTSFLAEEFSVSAIFLETELFFSVENRGCHLQFGVKITVTSRGIEPPFPSHFNSYFCDTYRLPFRTDLRRRQRITEQAVCSHCGFHDVLYSEIRRIAASGTRTHIGRGFRIHRRRGRRRNHTATEQRMLEKRSHCVPSSYRRHHESRHILHTLWSLFLLSERFAKTCEMFLRLQDGGSSDDCTHGSPWISA